MNRDGEASSYLLPLCLGAVSVNNLNGNSALCRKILRFLFSGSLKTVAWY